MNIDNKIIGSRIRNRRKALHMTQAQLAEAVGVSNNHISSVETGKVLPSLTLTIKISHALMEGIDRIPKSELTILKRIIDVFIESAGQIGREEN